MGKRRKDVGFMAGKTLNLVSLVAIKTD